MKKYIKKYNNYSIIEGSNNNPYSSKEISINSPRNKRIKG